MNDIIEKLGIKPILMYEGGGGYYVDGSQVRDLEQQRNELLEALIGSGITNHWFSINMQKAVEKATGKSWNEIKELL